MNQSFFIGALGAHQQQKSLTVTSNNIANVNAHGFKGGKSRFVQLMYENLRSAEGGDVKSGLGTCVWTTDTNFAPGPGAHTGRSQDYMIEGDGFFALVDLNTNEISFTRSGTFCMASMQRPVGILDENGQPMLDENGEPLPLDLSAVWTAPVTDADLSNLSFLTNAVALEGMNVSAGGWSQAGVSMTEEFRAALVPGSVIEISYESDDGKIWLVFPDSAAGWKRIEQGTATTSRISQNQKPLVLWAGGQVQLR